MRWIAALPLAALCVATLSAQQPSPAAAPLSLDQALAAALANNPEIAAARLQKPVDQANVGVAGERPNPDLTFEGTRETPREAVGISLPIELGGKRGARVTSARAAVATGEARTDQIIAGILDEVRRAYIDLAGAAERLRINQEVAGLFARARDAAHARFSAGDAPRRDDVASQADALAAQADVMQADGEVSATRATLNVFLGRPADAPLAVVLPTDSSAVPALEAVLGRIDQANADLRVLDRQIAEQDAKIGVAKSLRVPDLTAGGGISFDSPPEFNVGWRVNFGVTLPLFTTHRAGVLVEEAELTRLRAQRAATLADIRGTITADLARAASAAQRAQTYQRDILPLSQQDEAFAQDSYQSGQTGLDALILALQHARERRLAALQATLDLHTALADLERAINGPIR
jgi:cobalt-zinc-cadmium efflux system outer membrane protein